MSKMPARDLGLSANLLIPASRSHMRSLLDAWVVKSYATDSPEWQAIVRSKERQLRKMILRRRLLSAVGLARPLGRFRTTKKVKLDYNRIWDGEPWPQPVRMGTAGQKQYLTWDGEGLQVATGAVAQPHLDRLMHFIDVVSPRNVLEVGCGAGQNLFALAAECPKVSFSGLELSDSGILSAQRAQSLAAYSEKLVAYSPRPVRDPDAYRRIAFKQGSAVEMPYPDASFDLVFSRLAIEQMNDIKAEVLREIARVSRRWIVMIEPFTDFADTPLRHLASIKKDHFREPVSYLGQFGIAPLLTFADWPQKLDQGNGLVVAVSPNAQAY